MTDQDSKIRTVQTGEGGLVKKYLITPVPAPRMTRRDKWMKPRRNCVAAYFAFCDHVKELGIDVPDGSKVTFHLPMPASWSKRKRDSFNGRPHRQKPDVDNLCKALLDAVYLDDCAISSISIKKYWAEMPSIIVEC